MIAVERGLGVWKLLTNVTNYWEILCKSKCPKNTSYEALTKHYKGPLIPAKLKIRRWFRRLCTFFKIKIHGKPEYLLNKIPSSQIYYNTRNADQVETYYCRTDIFKNSFFPYTIIEWNKLDLDVCKSKSYADFQNTLLKLCRPNQHAIYSINNLVGLKLLTHLRLGLSHLDGHRFNHNFQNCINPLCSYSLVVKNILK